MIQMLMLMYFLLQVNSACGNEEGEIFYDAATHISKQDFANVYVDRVTLSLQSRCFVFWANYGALCINLFVKPSCSKELQRVMFSEIDGLSIRHICLAKAKDAWKQLSVILNITAEERVTLVNHCLENLFMVMFIFVVIIISLLLYCLCIYRN